MPVEQRGSRAVWVPLTIAVCALLVTGCGGAAPRAERSAGPAGQLPAPAGSPVEVPVDRPATGAVPGSPAPPSSAPASASPPGAAGPGSGSTARTVAENDAAKLRTLPAGTTQVVIVRSASMASTSATLQAYAKTGGVWRAALPAMAARIGGNGFSDAKREGDRTTPTGMYAFDATMYGIAASPGTRFDYHQIRPDDWWDENSESPAYNTFSHGPDPGGPSEPLWRISPQYTHFAVIRYNMPAVPYRGSGIFLHESTGEATLGCVSLAHDDLVAVLRWLDPAADPRIVLSPAAQLGRY